MKRMIAPLWAVGYIDPMATAVLRVLVDPEGILSPTAFQGGLDELRSHGLEVVAGHSPYVAGGKKEIELIVEQDDSDPVTDVYVAQCRAAFGVEPSMGVVTYISRGTEGDALGVLRRFGLAGKVTRAMECDDEVFTVTISHAASRTVAESRLRTALEAALNAEVRFVIL